MPFFLSFFSTLKFTEQLVRAPLYDDELSPLFPCCKFTWQVFDLNDIQDQVAL
jgi:hypothetical protein